jgi:hypothetical protein
MVEGLVRGDTGDDVRNHGRHIIKNGTRRYPKYTTPLTRKPRIANLILGRLVAAPMRFAIHLDRQLRARAEEIQHIAPRRMLMTKLETRRSRPQGGPEQNLGQGHLLVQASCIADNLSRPGQHFASPSTMLRMVPLPVPGRNC